MAMMINKPYRVKDIAAYVDRGAASSRISHLRSVAGRLITIDR